MKNIALLGKIVLVIGFILTLTGCKGQNESPPLAYEGPFLVKTATAQSSSETLVRKFPGRVIASTRVDLTFQVSGPLITFNVKNGEKVRQGDILARIDPRDFENQYNAAKSRSDKERLNFDRASQLIKSGTIPVADYDEMKAKYEVAVAQTNIAKKALDDTYLRAPFDGIVANTFVENYENVKAKEKILSLQDISSIDVIIDIPENILIGETSMKSQNDYRGTEIKNGYIIFNAIPKKQFKVSIKEYTTEADPITQTYKVTLTMPSPTDINILPGMTATLIYYPKETIKQNGVFIPINSVAIDDDGKSYVWLVDVKSMKVHKRLVSSGQLSGSDIYISSGLSSGETVVTAGLNDLHENDSVTIMNKKP